MRTLTTEPLTRDAFAPFGQVIEQEGAHHYPINSGNCERYHDLARVELGGVHATCVRREPGGKGPLTPSLE